MTDMLFGIVLSILEFSREHPIVAVPQFILLNVIFAALFLPCSLFSVVAGSIWGVYGIVISLAGSLAANAFTFFISRTAFKKKIKLYLSERFLLSDYYTKSLDKHDWKIIAAVQLNPILPAASFGYLIGLSNIGLGRYLLYSLVFSLPLAGLLNFLGFSISEFMENSRFFVFGLIALTLLVLLKFFGSNLGRRVSEKLVNDGK